MEKERILISVEDLERIVNTKNSLQEVCEAVKVIVTADDDADGEWTGNWDYYCSVCNKPFEYRTPHCPHCGAKMKNGREDF